MYHTLTLPVLNETIIVRSADGAIIPPVAHNPDYADYLGWLAEQAEDAEA